LNSPKIIQVFKNLKTWQIVAIVVLGLYIFGGLFQKQQPAPDVEYLTVYRIEPNVFYDRNDNVWYWGVNFRTDEPPMTKLNCKIDVLDKSGKVILSDAHEYNVVNDSTVIRFGDENLPTTTQEIAKAIDSFNIFCAKPKSG
jgi:hypothetical protein